MRRSPKILRLDEKNAGILDKYRRALELQQLGQLTVNGYLWKIFTALEHMKFKPLDEVNKGDLQDYIIFRRNNNKQRTVNGDIIALRKFFDWLKPKNDFFENIKVKQPKSYLPVDQLITVDDVKSMLSACKRQRDRAWLMMLWDTGCRLDEVLSRNINHVQFDEYGATMIVDGKTGMRKVRLIDSLPDLRLWLNQHPMKNNPNAPLFVTERRYDHKEGKIMEERRLDHNTIQNTLKTISRLARIKKNVHAHALRHARLTHFVKQGFMESELRILAGWTGGSNMAAIYVHLAGADVDKKLLIKNGLMTNDEELIFKTLKPGKCPRCSNENPVDAKFCNVCGFVLDRVIAKEVEKKDGNVLMEFMELMKREPRLLDMMKGITQSAETKELK